MGKVAVAVSLDQDSVVVSDHVIACVEEVVTVSDHVIACVEEVVATSDHVHVLVDAGRDSEVKVSITDVH